jgi:hypothetical protein
MAKDNIFICFSSKDEEIARQVVAFLESKGHACWISLRDVEPGQNYQESIVRALESSRAIVFLFSENSSQSGEIKKELSLGGSENIPVIPLRLAPITPSGALRYELATRQWVDAFPNPEAAFGKLLMSVREALRPGGAPKPAPAEAPRKARSGGKGRGAPSPAPAPAPRAPIVSAGSPEFEAVRSLLVRHVGPIAKILVQKAATDATSVEDFCERLAAHVSAPADRTAVLKALHTQLSVKS